MNIELTPRQLHLVSRGFSFICVGILLELLLFFHVFEIYLLKDSPVPAYVLALVPLYIGIFHLLACGRPGHGWHSTVMQMMIITTLHVYFVPFVYWWSHLPFKMYFIANMLCFALFAMWLLVLAARAAELAAEMMHYAFLIREAQAAGWTILLLLVMPTLALFSAAFIAMLRYRTSLYVELLHLIRRMPLWIIVAGLIPISMTVTCTWKASRAGMRRLREQAEKT